MNIIQQLKNIIYSDNLNKKSDSMIKNASINHSEESHFNKIVSQGFKNVHDYLDAFYFESCDTERKNREELTCWCNNHKFEEENLIWAYYSENKNKFNWLDEDFVKMVIKDMRNK